MTEVWNAYDLNRNQLPHLLIRGEKFLKDSFIYVLMSWFAIRMVIFSLCGGQPIKVSILATMSSEREAVCWQERIVRQLPCAN